MAVGRGRERKAVFLIDTDNPVGGGANPKLLDKGEPMRISVALHNHFGTAAVRSNKLTLMRPITEESTTEVDAL